jgi:hypothetical protein
VVALFYFNIGAAAFDQWFNAQQWQHGFEARTTWNLHCTRRDAVGGKADTVSNRYKTNGTTGPHPGAPRENAALPLLLHSCVLSQRAPLRSTCIHVHCSCCIVVLAVAERARQRHLGQRARQRARQCSRVPSSSRSCCLRQRASSREWPLFVRNLDRDCPLI